MPDENNIFKIDRISFVLPVPALDYLIWDLSFALPDLWGLSYKIS